VVDSAVLLSFLPKLLQSLWSSAMHAYTYSLLNAATYWFRTDSVVRVLVLVLGTVLPPVLVRVLPAFVPLGLRVLVLVPRAHAIIVS